MIVADTDVLIDALRGREPSRGRIERELRGGGLSTTVITVFELRSGAGSPSEAARVDRLLAALNILPLDEPSADEAARTRQGLDARGQGIGTADTLIAGICLARHASLMTRNRDHFERIPGLAVISMVADEP